MLMATEADIPEAISVTKGEGEERYLSIGQFDRTVDQCSPVELDKSKGESDPHPETVKHFTESEHTQVGCSMQVESKHNSFGISEVGIFLASLSDPKVDKLETCISENSQADESNKAEMEMPDNEKQLQKGKQFGALEEPGSEENEVMEETNKKAEQDISEMAKTENTQIKGEALDTGEASAGKEEDSQGFAAVAAYNINDTEPIQAIEHSKMNPTEHEGQTETNLQIEPIKCKLERPLNLNSEENEAATLRENAKKITTAEEEREVINLEQSFQEEGKEEKAITSCVITEDEIPEEKNLPVTDKVKETESGEAEFANSNAKDSHGTQSSDVEAGQVEDEKIYEVSKLETDEKFQRSNASSIEEEKYVENTSEVYGLDPNENIEVKDAVENIQEEIKKKEVTDTKIYKITSDDTEEYIISNNTPVKVYSTVLVGDKIADAEQISQVHSLEEAETELRVEDESHRSEDAQRNNMVVEAVLEQTKEGNATVFIPESNEEESVMNSHDSEKGTEKLNEEGSSIESIKEGNSNDLSPEYILEDGSEKFKDDKQDAEGEILKESESAGVSESTECEPNKNVERSEEFLDTSTVKREEGQQGEGKSPAPIKASEEDDRDEDTISVQVAEENDDNNGAATVTETRAEVPSNGEEDSQQALQKYEPGEEVQKFPDVMPEETKTESSSENAEVITCTKEEITIQNRQESSEKEKKEETKTMNNKKENDTAVEEVFEPTSTEEAGKHAVREIHIVEDHSQEFNDKEKNEENSTEYQACIEAADLSANTEENILEKQDIQKLSSSLEGEEKKQITKEEENYATNLKQEEKEAHAKCEEPVEAASMTEEPLSVIIEDRTELSAPISDDETHAEESNKTFVINSSFLSEVSETKIEKKIQEKDGPTVSNSGAAVVSHETGLKEVVAENNEKGLATILTDERTLNIEDSFNSKENLEKKIPTAADEVETGLKEAEAETKEQVTKTDIDPEEKDPATNLTDETALAIEDIDVQTEENLKSKENLEKKIPTAADEVETCSKEAEAENKEQLTNTDIDPEEKDLVTTLTDEPAFAIEDIDEKTVENLKSKENLEKKIQTAADEGETGLKAAEAENNEQVENTDIAPEGLATILTDETALNIEEIDVQEEENSKSKENLEEQVPTAADEVETGLKKAEEENNEQAKFTDIASGENGLATISSDETSLGIRDIDVQEEENFTSKEKLEKKIPIAEDEGETGLKEAKTENKEQNKDTDIAPEEKGLETILTEETALGIEDIDVQAEENFTSKEDLEKQISKATDEGETGLKESEEENNEHVQNTDIAPEEKGLETILTDEAALAIEDIHVQVEENFTSKEELEKQIPKATDGGETGLKESEAENNEHVQNTDTAPEEKGLETILTDETALAIEDIYVQAEENFTSKEDLEKQIPKATEEGETCLKEYEAENNEHVQNTDNTPEEKGQASILTDEAALAIEDIYVQAEENFTSKEDLEKQIPKTTDEGETGLKESEAENNEHVHNTDISPEEKGLATILTDEAALAIEDIVVPAEENFNSKENLETQILTAADEGETGLKGSEAEKNEQVNNTDLSPEENGLATILTDETELDIENVNVQAEENFNSKDKLEKQIPTIADGGEEKIGHGKIIVDDTPIEVYNTELVRDKTVEQSCPVQSLEKAEPKLGVEDEDHKSEDPPEKNNIIDEELQMLKQVPNEPKITDRDCNKEQTTEGNVPSFTPESIEETVKNSKDNEKETEKLREEGSSLENIEEGNVNNLSPAYIPEDGSEKFKDEKQDSVKSKGEILEKSEIAGVDELTICEANKNAEISEEFLNTSTVRSEEGQQGEVKSPDPTKASDEDDRDEDTISVQVAEDNDDNNVAATVTETRALVTSNGEKDSQQALQKYEPGEELQKFLHVMPEETKAESSSENAVVITCTEEERTIQNIQESSDKEKKEEDTKDLNNTKENDNTMDEVLETTSREQETRDHELQEIHTTEDHPQGVDDKGTTEENYTEYQASIEAADLSPSTEKQNLQGQVMPELSSSLVGEETTEEYSKEEDYVTNLKEEKTDVECKEPIEETKSETLENRTEPNKDLYAPISEEETHTEESNKTLAQTNSFLSEVTEKEIEKDIQEKDGFIVSNYDSVSGVVSDETSLKEAEVENNEQVKNTDISPEEKGLATILTDGTALDFEVTDVQAEENVKTNENLEKQSQTVADEGEEKIGHGNIILDDTKLVGDKTVEQSLVEAEPNLRVEDENHKSDDHSDKNNIIVEELQLLKVPDEPKVTDRDFNIEQTAEGNVAIFTPESIEATVKNSQDNEKETEKLKEEGSSIENIKEGNANDLSPECIPEDGSEKFKDDKQDAVKSGEIHKDSLTGGVVETTTYETDNNAESSEEIRNTSPVIYEGQKGGGESLASTKASREEDRDGDTFSIEVAEDDDDKNGAAIVTEISAKVTSNDEEESAQVLQKYEPEEEQVQVKTSDLAYGNKVCNLEVKVSELALEKLEVDATEEEIKESSEIVLKSGSESIDVVSKDDIIAEQKLHEGISKEQLQIPSSTLLSEEMELKASEHERGTTTQDKNIEEEHAKEMEVLANEDAGNLFAARSGEETRLQKEELRELKASELAPEKLDAGETEEEIKETFKMVSKSDSQSIDADSKDEIVADQTLPEGITDMQLHKLSYTLLPKEKELKAYQQEHGTTTQDKTIEEERTKEMEVPADENRGDLFATRSAEETWLQKEEPREIKVSELAPETLNAGETEEEFKDNFETVSKSDSQSTDVVSKDEIIVDQELRQEILDEQMQLQIPSSTLLPEENELKASQREHGTMAQEKSEENTLEKGFTESEDTRINKKHLEVAMFSSIEENPCETTIESNETIKNEVSNEEKHLDVEIADSRAPENWCETTIEANEIAKNEVSNEEIKDDKEVEENSQTISIGEEKIRESEQEDESRDEKYLGEKNETFDTETNEKQHEELSEVYEKRSMSGKVEERIISEDTSIKDHDPFFIKDKTTQDSVSEVAVEKDSSTEISQEEGTLGFEANEITQDMKQLQKTSYAATSIPTGNKEVVKNLQDPIVETSQGVATEIKAEECGTEKMSESGAISLADIMHESTKERTLLVTRLTEEKEATASKALQTEEEEEEEHGNGEEEKDDDEHKKADPGYDSPVIVEASTDAKVSPKKSHNILSGMGSKVKHSISKVKKAIIGGKSSSSKTQSEK